MTTSDDTPTPRLTERGLMFSEEARKHVAELERLDAIMTRGPLQGLDTDGGRMARALAAALCLLAKRFDSWKSGVDSLSKQLHVAQLNGLNAAAQAFIEEHRQ